MLAGEATVDKERLSTELDALAGFSDAPAPAVTRVLYTETDLKAREYLKGLCREAGLTLREDALGNLFARWEGRRPQLAAVATGSHLDAIPHSGRYDGVVGVVGGLEAIRALRRAGFMPERALELILFTAEEPTRFGVGCLGSRAMAGVLAPAALAKLKDAGGVTLEAARRRAGFSGPLHEVRLKEGHYHAFVELHIEQGPTLERAGLPIGVVTSIAAPATLEVTLEGEGGHAGTVLMPERRDALLAGAEVALAAERAATASGSPDTVATVGIFTVYPGAVNSIPSRASLTVDVRDTDLTRRDKAVADIMEAIAKLSERRGVRAEAALVNADPPARCDPAVMGAVQAAAGALGLEALAMVSRAYHDTLFMAHICPVGMIFIPSKGGLSHRPDEYSTAEDIERGVRVLARTLATLSS